MVWNISIFVIHLVVLAGLLALFRATPDALQRVVIGLLISAALLYLGNYWMAIIGQPLHWIVRRTAAEVEHWGVLLYVFRLVWVEQVCKNYSQSFRAPRG